VRPPEFVQREFAPLTVTELFEAVFETPMIAEVFCTLPPSRMTRLLPTPLLPTVTVMEFIQKELVPVTSTELFEALVS